MLPSFQTLRDHREFLYPASPLPPELLLLTRPSCSNSAGRIGGRLLRVMDKLRLCMGSVKSQTQYIVLFFQMACRAFKLLSFPCLTGNHGACGRITPFFPQGYVRTNGYSAPRRPEDVRHCRLTLAGLEVALRTPTAISKIAFDCTRRKQANQCPRVVQRCGFVWRNRKTRAILPQKNAAIPDEILDEIYIYKAVAGGLL